MKPSTGIADGPSPPSLPVGGLSLNSVVTILKPHSPVSPYQNALGVITRIDPPGEHDPEPKLGPHYWVRLATGLHLPYRGHQLKASQDVTGDIFEMIERNRQSEWRRWVMERSRNGQGTMMVPPEVEPLSPLSSREDDVYAGKRIVPPSIPRIPSAPVQAPHAPASPSRPTKEAEPKPTTKPTPATPKPAKAIESKASPSPAKPGRKKSKSDGGKPFWEV